MPNQSSSPASAGSVDAIELLRQDHQRVRQLFSEFESLQRDQSSDRQRLTQVVQTISAELTTHAQLEEEIFYPAVEQATGDKQFVQHAREDHQQVRDLVQALTTMQADDPELASTVTALASAVNEHVREEEENLFPHATGRLDAQKVGAQLAERRGQIESPGDGPVENADPASA